MYASAAILAAWFKVPVYGKVLGDDHSGSQSMMLALRAWLPGKRPAPDIQNLVSDSLLDEIGVTGKHPGNGREFF
jgi:hypothetical protein